jgi:hypothetical protein
LHERTTPIFSVPIHYQLRAAGCGLIQALGGAVVGGLSKPEESDQRLWNSEPFCFDNLFCAHDLFLILLFLFSKARNNTKQLSSFGRKKDIPISLAQQDALNFVTFD